MEFSKALACGLSDFHKMNLIDCIEISFKKDVGDDYKSFKRKLK